jgi:hypothetical protein
VCAKFDGCLRRRQPRVRGSVGRMPLNLTFPMPLRAVVPRETDKPKIQALSRSRSLSMQNSDSRGATGQVAPGDA